jgi:hypothetical protein
MLAREPAFILRMSLQGALFSFGFMSKPGEPLIARSRPFANASCQSSQIRCPQSSHSNMRTSRPLAASNTVRIKRIAARHLGQIASDVTSSTAKSSLFWFGLFMMQSSVRPRRIVNSGKLLPAVYSPEDIYSNRSVCAVSFSFPIVCNVFATSGLTFHGRTGQALLF